MDSSRGGNGSIRQWSGGSGGRELRGGNYSQCSLAWDPQRGFGETVSLIGPSSDGPAPSVTFVGGVLGKTRLPRGAGAPERG